MTNTTLKDIKSNKNLTWLINNSEITLDDRECKMTHFKGRLPYKTLNELKNWFNKNDKFGKFLEDMSEFSGPLYRSDIGWNFGQTSAMKLSIL